MCERKEEMARLMCMCEDWSIKLGLNDNSTPLHQNLKQIEEFGELAKHIQKQDILEIMDAIGDTLVVACVAATQVRKFAVSENYHNLSLVSTNEANLNSPIHNKEDLPYLFWQTTQAVHRYSNYCVDAFTQKAHGHYLLMFAGKLVTELDKLAKCLNVDVVECLKMAYATIYFRSGQIVDGVFVKREPEAIIKISTKKLKLPIDNLIDEVVQYARQNEIDLFKVEFYLPSNGLEPQCGMCIKEI